MLARKQRLTKADFERYFKLGKRYHSPNLQLIHVPEPHAFAGSVAVGKKVFTRAVKRNTMRRRLYGVLYRAHITMNLVGVFIIIAKPSAKTLSRQALLAEARGLVSQPKV